MRTRQVLLAVFLVSRFAYGQISTTPPAPLTAPTYDLSLGYDYFVAQTPSAGTISLNGLLGAGTMNVTPRWAATVECSYVRNSDVFGTGRNGHTVTLLGGPAFYFKEYRGADLFTHALVGSALVDSSVPTNFGYLHGWVSRPSFGAGGGLERHFAGPLTIRVYGDYIRTEFVNSLAAIAPQNSFRSVVTLSFRLPFSSPLGH
jgi:hypothetical protein